MRAKTSQEIFWEGEFGQDYTERNRIVPQDRAPFFASILQKTHDVRSICELGANRGHNLRAIALLNDSYELTGVDVNQEAVAEMGSVKELKGVHSSIQDFCPQRQFDLVFTCGVLIHLCPDDLPFVYRKIYDLSSRYILINEYFNPSPVELNYRGHAQRLFKRDFGSEIIEANGGNLTVIDYGFLWQHMQPSWDNTTWFLLEKSC